jgi:D-alanyl-D-alanine-carboxypeptidase/D-alanyl-D-alanine-endopeptidase
MKAGLFAMVVLLLTTLLTAQEPSTSMPKWQALVQTQTEPLLKDNQLNALVIGVMDRTGKKTFLTVGTKPDTLARLDEHTIFEIGSITKTMTSLVLADGIQKKELLLDDPVQNYLPKDMTMPKRGEHIITLEDLATHTSGLPRLAPLQITQSLDPKIRANPYATMDAAQLTKALAGAKARESKKPTPDYSNFGVGLLGYALCQKYGKPYGTLLDERIFQPLNMKETWLTVPESEKVRFIDGFDPAGKPAPHWDFTDATAGAGGIRSTAHDMLLYVEAGSNRTQAKRIAFDVALHPQYEMGRGHIGLGWILGEIEGKKFAWHNGGTAGFMSFCAFSRSPQVGVVVLSNRAKRGGEIDKLGMGILRELLK